MIEPNKDSFDYYWEQKEALEADESWEDVYRLNGVNPFYNKSPDHRATKP
ncbi:MAG: hypothetical protein ACE5J7_00060 [Candidatus Aenigmatarchaeota archaeon]